MHRNTLCFPSLPQQQTWTMATLAVSGTPCIAEAAEDGFGLWLLTVQFACDSVDEALKFFRFNGLVLCIGFCCLGRLTVERRMVAGVQLGCSKKYLTACSFLLIIQHGDLRALVVLSILLSASASFLRPVTPYRPPAQPHSWPFQSPLIYPA